MEWWGTYVHVFCHFKAQIHSVLCCGSIFLNVNLYSLSDKKEFSDLYIFIIIMIHIYIRNRTCVLFLRWDIMTQPESIPKTSFLWYSWTSDVVFLQLWSVQAAVHFSWFIMLWNDDMVHSFLHSRAVSFRTASGVGSPNIHMTWRTLFSMSHPQLCGSGRAGECVRHFRQIPAW